MRKHATTAFLLAGTILAGSAFAAEPVKFDATLTAHAILPADAKVAAPADAPADLKTAGKYTGPAGKRVDQLGALKGTTSAAHKDFPRFTGYSMPIDGQSVQGFSGIRALGDDRFLVITDNGFGAKSNSADAALMVHTLKVDWKAGIVNREGTTFLSDPDKKVPFRIANEASTTRYLTGADFDIESIQPVGDNYWFGDELGPFLIKTDKSGKVLAVFDTIEDGKPVRSPDNPAIVMPGAPNGKTVFNQPRSKGFEGMAQSKDGKFLYGLLEGPTWDTDKLEAEKVDGKEVIRILEFDVAKEAWTGRSWKYPLEANGNAIGDFNLVDGSTGLIIERDNGEGDAAKACPADKPAADCFFVPALMKRVYKIEFNDANAGGLVRKIGYIDLLDIKDPKEVARQGGKNGKFTFPFVTIENVDVVDATHIVVGNDNNFPYSAGRTIDRNDDNELVILDVADFLKAK